MEAAVAAAAEILETVVVAVAAMTEAARLPSSASNPILVIISTEKTPHHGAFRIHLVAPSGVKTADTYWGPRPDALALLHIPPAPLFLQQLQRR